MTASESVEFLLVGAGITNLSFAATLKSQNYLIVEAANEIGGYCRTVKQDGFTWDYSGHFFHFRHKDIEEQLVSRIGRDRVRSIAKSSKIFTQGTWIDFPFQKNIHQLPKDAFIECLVDLVGTLRPAAAAQSVMPNAERAPANFYEMLYAKFGRGISEQFLVPYNEKLYATDLRKLDVDAMGRFFPYADPLQIIGGFRSTDNSSYNATFTYPEGGAIEYVNAIAQDVRQDRIALNERLERIDLQQKIAYTNRRSVRFEHLISAIPFAQLLRVAGLAFDEELYTYNKVLVFNLGFDRKGPKDLHWVYYPERDISFYRAGFYDNIFNSERMSLYIELGYRADAVLGEKEIDAARERVLKDLERAGVVSGHRLISQHHVVLDPAYVHITSQSNADVAQKKAILATRGVYSVGRYGSWTYCSIEDNIVEARELARRFNATS